MITIRNKSSVAEALLAFDEAGPMKPSFYDRVVDVMEELFKFTLLNPGREPDLVDRYSERKESPSELSTQVNHPAI